MKTQRTDVWEELAKAHGSTDVASAIDAAVAAERERWAPLVATARELLDAREWQFDYDRTRDKYSSFCVDCGGDGPHKDGCKLVAWCEAVDRISGG